MQTMTRRLASAITLSVVFPAAADEVTIHVDLGRPSAGEGYVLAGQSAFFVTHADGGLTSGGQMDGIGSGLTDIVYTEVFPPPAIGDYLRFGYFGVVETRDVGGGVIDLSLVVAMRAGVGAGALVGDVLGGLDEGVLVGGMSTMFDSDEFFSLFAAATGSPDTSGIIGLPPIARPGDTLELVAFTGGVDGDRGVVIGSLSVSIVPGPGVLGAMIGPGALACRRRRRC